MKLFSKNDIFKNISYLFSQNIIRMFFGLVVGIWMARHLGKESYGVFNFVISFLFLFQPLISFGLEEATVKKIVNSPKKLNEIMGSTFFMRVFSMLASWCAMFIVAFLVGFENETNKLLFIYAASSVFSPFNNIDSYFFAKLKLSKLTLFRSALFIVLSFIKVGLILAGFGLKAFIYVSAAEMALMALVGVVLYKMEGHRLGDWKVETALMKQLSFNSFPVMLNFFLMRGIAKVDQVFIAKLSNFSSLGLYGAAVKLVDVWQFLPVIISNVYFSKIVEKGDEEKTRENIKNYFALLLWTSLALFIGCYFFSGIIISLLYGSGYAGAEKYLELYSLQFIFVFYSYARLKYFFYKEQNYLNLVSSALIFLFNCILNFYLIKEFDANGAIYAAILANVIVLLGGNLFSEEFRRINALYLSSLWHPLVLIKKRG